MLKHLNLLCHGDSLALLTLGAVVVVTVGTVLPASG